MCTPLSLSLIYRIFYYATIIIGIAAGVLAASNFVEIPHVSNKSNQSTYWLLSSNDGFGHNYGTDEDNLRTYGINAGASLFGRLLLHADWTSFTDRNRSYEASRRIDELKIVGAYRLLHLSHARVVSSLYSGGGVLSYGNFGTLAIQEGAHGINNNHTRPVPETYDAPTTHTMGYLYADIYFPELFTNLHTYAHRSNTSDYNIDISGSYQIVKPMLQSSFALSHRWNRVLHAGDAAKNCYDREDGTWLSNKTFIGPLMVERGFNLDNLSQFSYVGFRTGDIRTKGVPQSPFGFTYSIGWPIGHNSWIEFFRVYPFEKVNRLGLFLRTYHTENLIENTVTHLDDDRLARRTKESSIGAEYAFFDSEEYTLLNGFVFGGAGFTRDTKTTYDQLEARILDEKSSFMIHGGTGLRLLVPDFIFKVKGRGVGAEIRANVRYNANETGIFSNPDILLSWGLIFTER